jgi:elongation factor P
MKISANDLRSSDIIEINNELWKVLGMPEHIKPGKGPAYIQASLKNLITSTKVHKRFKSSDSINKAYIENKVLQYLYSSNQEITFMDNETFEQLNVPMTYLGKRVHLLNEGMLVGASLFDGKIIELALPESVEVEILFTDPHIKGSTATGQFKKATIKADIDILVPQYLEIGDKVLIKSDDYTFVKKAK